MHPRSAVSPQKLGSHVEQLEPATLGRHSHVPSTGWQRSLLDPIELHKQPGEGRQKKNPLRNGHVGHVVGMYICRI